MIRLLTLVLALTLVLPALPAHAETAAEKGERIARAASNANAGYGDLTVQGEMILRTKGGAESTRRFDAQWVETRSGARSLLIFRWPGDIRNTALLTHSIDKRRDDQWLYLPSLGKVRRISASGRSGSFVGSEFAYEDMTDQEADKFEHSWLRDGPCPAGGTCHIVDRRPRERSGYSLQRVWFDTAHNRVMQVQYFDRRGAHVKTLTTGGWQRHNGRFWRAGRMQMVNHLTGKSTILTWSGHRFDTGVNPNAMTPNALKRIR